MFELITGKYLEIGSANFYLYVLSIGAFLATLEGRETVIRRLIRTMVAVAFFTTITLDLFTFNQLTPVRLSCGFMIYTAIVILIRKQKCHEITKAKSTPSKTANSSKV